MAYNAQFYAENKERYAEYSRAYCERYPEKNKLRLKKYKENNKEKFAGYERKRRALALNQRAEPYTVKMLLETYGTICYICNTEIDLLANRRSGYPGWEKGLQIDHVIPLSRSGPDTLENARPTHGLCNSKKNRYSLKEGK